MVQAAQALAASEWIDACSAVEIDEEDVMRWDHGASVASLLPR
jgi:hypothetical protein